MVEPAGRGTQVDTTGPYGATYYALAGLHAGHPIAGLVLFGIVIYRARVRDHFSPTGI